MRRLPCWTQNLITSDIFNRGPKFSVEQGWRPSELWSLPRQASDKAEPQEKKGCLLESVGIMVNNAQRKGGSPRIAKVARYVADDLRLLMPGKEGWLVATSAHFFVTRALGTANKTPTPKGDPPSPDQIRICSTCASPSIYSD